MSAIDVATGRVLFSKNLSSVLPPQFYVEACEGVAVTWGLPHEVIVTSWSQYGEINPGAIIALALDDGGITWVSDYNPSNIGAPVWVAGALLFQWVGGSMTGQLGGLYLMDATNGTVLGGIDFCNECGGQLDARSGRMLFADLWGIGGPNNIKLLDALHAFEELWHMPARDLGPDDDPICPCSDTIMRFAGACARAQACAWSALRAGLAYPVARVCVTAARAWR